MGLFIVLLLLLIIAIQFFIRYPFFKRKILPTRFSDYVEKKIYRFAKKENLDYIGRYKIPNDGSELHNVNHILFGKKYIYIVSDYVFIGELSGSSKDKTWFYKKRHQSEAIYIDNIYKKCEQDINEFGRILNVEDDVLMSIAVIPNECYFDVKDSDSDVSKILHLSELLKFIKEYELKEIPSLDGRVIGKLYRELNVKNQSR